MPHPETQIFIRLARWPGPSYGPAGQGRFGAGPALTGGMYAPVGPASRTTVTNHSVGAAQGTTYQLPSNWIAAFMPRKQEERSMNVFVTTQGVVRVRRAAET